VNWNSYLFKICYEDSHLRVEVHPQQCIFTLESGSAQRILVYGKEYLLEDRLVIPRNNAADYRSDPADRSGGDL